MALYLDMDIGSMLKDADCALAPASITAGAGNDNVAVNGPIINRIPSVGADVHQSAKLCVFGTTTLGASETLQITITFQHGNASNLSDAATYATKAAHTVRTGAVTAGVWSTCLDLNLRGAKQYVRAVITANLSAANTDTVQIAAALIQAGGSTKPAA